LGSRDDPIYVTRPFLPPLEELIPLLEEIWARKFVTNNGPFHERLQAELAAFFDVEHLSLTANGMLALEGAIDAACLSGEVITTPYSFVATSHAVKRAQLTPVFADIRPDDLNIDPVAVEAAISERTSAIVAVHCYGNPCDVDALARIAERNGLALIYDAAHAFGVRFRNRSLPSWGDFSALSFHGTKMFNTFEGGAVISRTAGRQQAIDSGRNFGIASEVSIPGIGTNAKMSEFNAALGLVQLRYFDKVRRARSRVDRRYREALSGIPGIRPLPIPPDTEPNFSYFPVLVTEEFPVSREALYDALKAEGIFSRRYFYPLLSSLPTYRDLPSAAARNLPVATRAAEQILCLPIYSELTEEDQDRVIKAILGRSSS
jgi:dTDP-4-amino-4,6-dideoxygalactose transaminase